MLWDEGVVLLRRSNPFREEMRAAVGRVISLATARTMRSGRRQAAGDQQ